MRAELGSDPTRAPPSELNLPAGFRFFPTDEELVVHYLCRKAACQPFAAPIIAEVELYKFNPWDLPAKALFGEREWYFFSPRDRKYPNGSRPNRAAGGGYWKATGTDKPISTLTGKKKVGVKKALVFYKGKAPKGIKTNWIMHEYRLADNGESSSRPSTKRKGTLRLDDWVLCRIYKKSSSAADREREVSDKLSDMQAEQSESSGLDDVLATLSELGDPVDAVQGEAEGAHADMFTSFETDNSSLQSSLERMRHETAAAAAAYSSPGDGRGSGAGLDSKNSCRQAKEQQSEYVPEASSCFMRRESMATPDSSLSRRQCSPLEHHLPAGGQQEGDDGTVRRRPHDLAHLPLTQLLSTSFNTQNLGVVCNPLFELDLGLPSPLTMLAQGAYFGGCFSMEPDTYLLQSPRLIPRVPMQEE